MIEMIKDQKKFQKNLQDNISSGVKGGLKGAQAITKNIQTVTVNVAQGNREGLLNSDCFDDFISIDTKKPYDFEVSKNSAQQMYFNLMQHNMFPGIKEAMEKTLEAYEKELYEGREGAKNIYTCNLNSIDIIAFDERKFLIQKVWEYKSHESKLNVFEMVKKENEETGKKEHIIKERDSWTIKKFKLGEDF